MDSVTAALAQVRLMPVVVIDDADLALSLADALKAGGLPVAEVTFRTAGAERALRAMAEDADLLVGAGTITRLDQVDQAIDAGARYIVTPGFSLAVVQACQARNVPVFPGVATPTEIQMALDAGLETVKFFPAEIIGGVPALKAMSAPYGTVRFVPTGGINPQNLRAYLELPSVLAVGGSWMVDPSLLAEKNFVEVTRLAAEAATFVTEQPSGFSSR